MILSQLIEENKNSLKIFHLNGQRLDWNRAQNVTLIISQCTQLMVVDFYDCLINNDECLLLFDALKRIPTLKEVNNIYILIIHIIHIIHIIINYIQINFGKNDINAETRMTVQDEIEKNYPNITVIF